MSISAVLLTYQEGENLKLLLPKLIDNLHKTGEKYEILIIDTETALDNTPEICQQFGVKYYNQELSHFAGAFKTGIYYATMDKFLIMDSDGSHNPASLIEMNKKFIDDQCDIVIGSRYVAGGKTHDFPTSVLMSKTLNIIFRFVLGIPAHDLSTDYRIYDTLQLKAVAAELQSENYEVLQEVLLHLKLHNNHLKIAEVPIIFDKRRYGISKRRLVPFIWDYLKSFFKLSGIRIITFFKHL